MSEQTKTSDLAEIRKIYTGKKKYIFISYAHKDKAQVLHYVRFLIDRGYRVWYDHQISSSTDWLERISYRLSECYVFMPFISPNYVASENCMKEMEDASKFNKVLIPVYLHPTEFGPAHQKLYISYVERMHARYCEQPTPAAIKSGIKPLKAPEELVKELEFDDKPLRKCRKMSGSARALLAVLVALGLLFGGAGGYKLISGLQGQNPDPDPDAGQTPEEDEREEGGVQGDLLPTLDATAFYDAAPLAHGVQVGETVSDGLYNYHFMHVGSVQSVPLHAEGEVYHSGEGNTVYGFSHAEYQKSVPKRLAETIERMILRGCGEQENDSLLATGLEKGFAELPEKVQAMTRAELAAALDMTEEQMSTSSIRAVSDMAATAHQKSAVIPQKAEAGYYCYTITADVEVYAAIVCGRHEDVYAVEYFVLPKDNSYRDGLAFRATELSTPSPVRFFFEKDLDAVALYTTWVGIYRPQTAVIYEDSTTKRITDKGVWGLEQGSKEDLLDLSAFSDYLNAHFALQFDISLTLREKYGGNQEIYLYNQQATVSNSADRDLTRADVEELYGLVAGEGKLSTPNDTTHTHNITWEVAAADCRETMYLRYDAQGDFEDDWDRISVRVTVTVIPYLEALPDIVQ